jgi:hypothetical protein
MSVPNPFGANGTTSDPREQIMWELYVKGIQNGIENAYESAKEAGYSEDHARNITLQGWFKERKDKLRRKEMLSKAERNLNKILDLNYEKEDGEIKTDVLKVVSDVSKNITSTLGKDEGYSNRTEMTGKGGEDLFPIPLLKGISNELPNNDSP